MHALEVDECVPLAELIEFLLHFDTFLYAHLFKKLVGGGGTKRVYK